jgi:6-hydroxymethylpterin diphosphokinase MptE-like protein
MQVKDSAGALGLELVQHMSQMTWDKIGEMAIENCRRNVALLGHGQSIAALRDEESQKGGSAIVIAAGPSIARRDPISAVKELGYRGRIIATDSAMYYCLRNGVVPDLVVTVDPNSERVVRWFGQKHLNEAELAKDDYFRRQDMDASFAEEIRVNNEVTELLAEYGPRMKIALATCASPPVVERVLETGMQIYWWNPMLDDPEPRDSKTREIFKLNRLPCINGGGNVGTACYMIAHAVLGKKRVAVTGMDFGYYGDTPYRSTQYYHDAVNLVGEENLDSIFIHVRNPHLNQDFYTDPAYWWYRQAFLELAADADCQTFNCTEGGVLFGDNVSFVPLRDFLQQDLE